MKRREWWIFDIPDVERCDLAYRYSGGNTTHVREVLSDDPNPEWVDELVRLCGNLFIYSATHDMRFALINIQKHLAKRGKQ